MAIFIVLVFIAGYTLIAFEHPLKIDKAASALLTGVLCWLVLLFGADQMPAFAHAAPEPAGGAAEGIHAALFHNLGEISQILFFLLGAMTIVELVDQHDGFKVITDKISTSDRVKLLWIIAWVTFFLSALLDNMTTAIILCALLRRLLKDKEDLWLFGGFVVIAANAGGAWSPIGDVTTIMLWIGGQVSTFHIVSALFLASVASLVAPLLAATYFLRSKKGAALQGEAGQEEASEWTPGEQTAMFVLGGAGLLLVPAFKSLTHFPPYMGILLSLALIWFFTAWLHRGKDEDLRHEHSVATMLHRIDTPSILFFLGILMAVGALDTSGHLHLLAEGLDRTFGNIYVINTLIGALSAIVDNVPLVAASMGMYDMSVFPADHDFWNLLAYCAGTGGSMLIIGSAAGVAAMGILKIDFLWYLKRVSGYAALGYIAGIATYYLTHA